MKIRLKKHLVLLLAAFELFQPSVLAKTFTIEEANTINKLLEDGREALKKDDLAGALEKFKAAKELAPDTAVVWVNYGFALGRQGQYDEAVDCLKKAVKLDANLPMAWLDLASLYQSSGQMALAIETFTEFIKRFPNDTNAKDAKSIMAILKKNQNSSDSSNSNDYYQDQSKAGIQKWDLARLPLKVFIEEGSPADDYKPSYKPPVIEAFQNWQDKSNQLLKFDFIDTESDADIIVRWTKDTRAVVAQGEAGDCRRDLGTHGIKRARITILTCAPQNAGVPFNEAFIRWVAMHEIGHALGITAHSSNANDIMYSTVTFDIERKSISARDIATLKRIYETSVASEGSPVELYNEAAEAIAVQNKLPPANQNYLIPIEKLEKLRSLFPNFDKALAPLGYSYCMEANRLLTASQPKEAEDYYKKALSTLPKGNPGIENMARQNYATLLRLQHRDSEAQKILH